MEILLLGMIPLVLLAGIVLFAIGNRNWNWGTIVAAMLVLLAATGYTFLIGMLAQRERAWREIVGGYQLALARERDALVPGGAGGLAPDRARKPLVALADDLARWRRVRQRIETWRGRHWEKAAFEPPTTAPDGTVRPGRLTIEDVEKLTINPGAELYLFDAAPVEEQGRFLGAFSVQGVNGNALTIVPALPPSDAEQTLWRAAREEVTVYENLPVDRWLAFHRTVAPSGEEAAALGPTDTHEQRKMDPEDLLKHLEGRLEMVRQHAEAVPAEEWPKIVEGIRSREILPGTYWATVEFKDSHTLPLPKGNPADSHEFSAGQKAAFDLETAQKLKEDGVVEIVAVERRRPLADAQTAIRGSDYRLAGEGDAGDRPTIHIDGIAFVRRMLESDIASIVATIESLRTAKTSAENQLQLQAKEGADLDADREKWRTDAEAAARVSERFATRLAEAGTELTAVETAIVELGRELAGASALLGGSIDARAPPPVRRPSAAAR